MTNYVYRLRTDGSYVSVGRVTFNYMLLPFKFSHYTKIALFGDYVGKTFDAYKYQQNMHLIQVNKSSTKRHARNTTLITSNRTKNPRISEDRPEISRKYLEMEHYALVGL